MVSGRVLPIQSRARSFSSAILGREQEITLALPLFAQLRRYTLAVLGAAETAADFAGILYTDSPANGEADAIEANTQYAWTSSLQSGVTFPNNTVVG